MDFREIGWGSVDWIQLAQDRDWWLVLVNMELVCSYLWHDFLNGIQHGKPHRTTHSHTRTHTHTHTKQQQQQQQQQQTLYYGELFIHGLINLEM
jgi:hypothetical protein